MTRILKICSAAILALTAGFTATALAANALAAHAVAAGAAVSVDQASWLDLLRPVIDAFQGGHRIAAVALAVVAALALLKRYGGLLSPKLEAFVHGDIGGTATVFGMAFAGAIATETAGTSPWSWSMSWTALGIGAVAIGGYSVLRKLVVDRLMASKWYATAPGWVKTILSLLTVLGAKPDPVGEAAKAGDAAVAAAPAPGVAGIVGAPTVIK